jgi:sulfide:quinone oxidoreductase
VLGAGFGGLELTTILSETFGEEIDIVLIDKSDSFVFGFAKFDIMFGKRTPQAVRYFYRNLLKPGVRFIQSTIWAIDPLAKRVETDQGAFTGDILLVALGAEMDLAATPGLIEGGNEFYSVAGAEALRDILPTFEKGHAVVGITAMPYKCPPAPNEAALLLHDYLVERGRRAATEISLVMPSAMPIGASQEASALVLSAFEERGIRFIKERLVTALDPTRKVARLNDGNELPYDLFLGVPVHRVPHVVEQSGLAENGWIPVNKHTLETRFSGVYAVGDVTSVGTPKAGAFAESAARAVAARIIAQLRGGAEPPPYEGIGSCYLEFGHRYVGRLDANVFSGPAPVTVFKGPSEEFAADKVHFETSRVERWFKGG